jgi:high-affinity iron transporter
MLEGALVATFLIVFRETLEAGLIVGIILTVLTRLRATRYVSHVLWSVVAAIGASFLGGWALASMAEAIEGILEKVLEGSVSLAACGILTYMIFWMDAQSKKVKSEIEDKVEQAVSHKELVAIISLSFLAVFREGAETVLFLQAVAMQASQMISFLGGAAGFFLATAVACLIFVGGRKVPLKPLFRSTGLLLLVIAAGLLAYGVHEFQELGWIPTLIHPVWDINPILSEKEGLGSFLKALFGYNGNPSLVEDLVYSGYLAIVWTLLRRSAPNVS